MPHEIFRNLVTLEIREHDTYRMPEAYEIQDDMHFSTPEGLRGTRFRSIASHIAIFCCK